MFSQNVFSARDVLANSALNDNNAWTDSQSLYSQVMYSSQNSQMNSMDVFSQQKGPVSSKFDQYQRSQSQPEDEPPNYYSKYVNKPPLLATTSKNIKLPSSIQALIEEEKRSVSMKEERDMLQTFINLLKDYTKEVDSSFKTFKSDMETTLQTIVQNTEKGTQRIDDKVTKMKHELVSILEAKDKESVKKEELNKNISEQTGTIKVLETKTEILEKQLDEMKKKESAYVEQKTKYQELEQKYLLSVNQWNAGQASSYIGNTPPLSQHTNPVYALQIPPLHHNDWADPGMTLSNASGGSSSSAGYGYNSMETQTNNYYNPLGNYPMVNQNLHQANTNVVSCEPNPPYSTSAQIQGTIFSGTQDSMKNYNQTPLQPNQPHPTTSKSAPQLAHCNKVYNTESPVPNQCGLNISRRNSKRPKKSPMATVKPQIRQAPSLIDDEIFVCDVVESPETSTSSDEKDPFRKSRNDSEKRTPCSGNVPCDDEKITSRQEEFARRKRKSMSMLGSSCDDSKIQEIKNAIWIQTRMLSKRNKSLP